jgi:Asp-tRNA(Asn)/Glu-tRNA(Gln) amidotransferase A subunit family amidase
LRRILLQHAKAHADGVPVGISLVGWPGADETLLDLAKSLDSARGE